MAADLAAALQGRPPLMRFSSHTLTKSELLSGFFLKKNPPYAIPETTSLLENRI
jgi:hypothetical protein